MKTNIYTLLILVLSFSLGNAQSNIESVTIESNKVVSVSENTENNDITIANDLLHVESEKEVLFVDENKLKEAIARSSSDIRIYLNRERKVENIKLLFPKINKALKA